MVYFDLVFNHAVRISTIKTEPAKIMKELTIIRHAKSDWGNEGLRDIDRHLNERGYRDAYFMSDWIKQNHAAPQYMVSSTATRALSTALIFCRTLDLGVSRLLLEPGIYEAGETQLHRIIGSINPDAHSVFMFGHNPGLTNLCNLLIKDFFIDNLPTCGIVSINFKTNNWKQIEAQSGILKFTRFPKEFKHND